MPTLNPNTNAQPADRQPRQERVQRADLSACAAACRTASTSARNYTLQKGISTIGDAADELNTANIQDPNNPFDDPRQLGPNLTTDSRHLINISATFQLPWGFRVAPIFFFRSALPVNLVDGRDLNLDGDAIDIPTTAYAVDSFDAEAAAPAGDGQGSSAPARPSTAAAACPRRRRTCASRRSFHLGGRANVEAIGEIFNLFNNINPSGFRARVIIPTTGAPDPTLLQPTTLLRRLPSSGTARRSARTSVHVLVRRDRPE